MSYQNKRIISGIPQQPMSFSDSVRRMRACDTDNSNSSFVDVAGGNSISSFEQHQQIPEAYMRPSIMMPAGRSVGIYSDGLSVYKDDHAFTYGRDDNRDKFPYMAPSLQNYQLHGM